MGNKSKYLQSPNCSSGKAERLKKRTSLLFGCERQNPGNIIRLAVNASIATYPLNLKQYSEDGSKTDQFQNDVGPVVYLSIDIR